ERLKQAKTKSEYQRALCVFHRATTGLNPQQIADMLSWNTGTVRRIQSEFIRKGDSIFCISDRGGRHGHQTEIRGIGRAESSEIDNISLTGAS
ncbi:MAG: helix-turn-helix domain-containing protein, partial [Smithella sp.]